MQLSSSNDKLPGLGLIGPADIDAGMVTPRVPNHQVCFEDDHISGNGLSIWSKKESNKEQHDSVRSYRWKQQKIGLEKSRDHLSGFQLPEKQHKRERRHFEQPCIWPVIPQDDQQVALWLFSLGSLSCLQWHSPRLCVKSFTIHYIDYYLVCQPFCAVVWCFIEKWLEAPDTTLHCTWSEWCRVVFDTM